MRVNVAVALAILVSLVLISVVQAGAVPPPGTSTRVSAPEDVAPHSVRTLAATPAQWALVTPGGEPRDGHGFVYDSRADLLIAFGGAVTANTFTNSTWTYDWGLNSWMNATPVVSPSPRAGFAMVYDSRADRVVVFGGETSSGVLTNQTWIFDVTNLTWTQRSPFVHPTARAFAAMAYDAAADRVILFGGLNVSFAIQSDTWAYDVASDTWTRLGVTGPGPRFGAMMTYDSVAQRDLLFGGLYQSGLTFAARSDTWSFDYTNLTWTDKNPVAHPSGRAVAALTFDSAMDRVLLFGGTDNSGPGSAIFNDTWAYDHAANTWANVTPVVSPAPRQLAAMAFSFGANRTILYGGANLNGIPSNDAWAFYDGPSLPTAPRNLVASGVGGHVTLTWQAPYSAGASPVSNYTIYRGTGSGGETLLETVGNVLTYLDAAVVVGTLYFYQVAAVTAVGEGPVSSEVSATPVVTQEVPSAPQNLAATAGNAQVALLWQAPASNGTSAVTEYNLYRGTAATGLSLFATLGVVFAYTDTAVTNSVTYYYEVSAVNGAGEGPMSNEVSATPAAPPPPDTTRPTVTIASPANNSVLSSTTVTVSGTASDNVALQKVELSTDGSTWSAATGTTAWSGSVTLHSGSNTIYARATDTSGNTRTAMIAVQVVLATQTPQGLDLGLFLLLVVVSAVAVSAVILILLRRRKREIPPPPPPGP